MQAHYNALQTAYSMMKYVRTQNFPRLVIILVIFGAILWYFTWRSWADDRKVQYVSDLSQMGISLDEKAKLGGFPGYFEFTAQNGEVIGDDFQISWGKFTTIMPLKNNRRIFMRIEDGFDFDFQGQNGKILTDPLRVQADFDDSGELFRIVAEGHDLTLDWQGKSDRFSRLVIAYDKTQSPQWAMRIFFEGKENDVLTAESFPQLFEQFQSDYLQ